MWDFPTIEEDQHGQFFLVFRVEGFAHRVEGPYATEADAKEAIILLAWQESVEYKGSS